MWNYSQIATERFLEPRNIGILDDPDVVGVVHDEGTAVYKVYLKLGEDGRISDALFDFQGNACSVASADVLMEMVKGRTPAFALELHEENITRALEGLPEASVRHPLYSLIALRDALNKLLGAVEENEDDGLVCYCNHVTVERVREAIRQQGIAQVMQIRPATKAGTGCGSCMPDLAVILRQELLAIASEKRQDAFDARLSGLDPATSGRMQVIDEILESEVRPGLMLDGGDIEVMGVEGSNVSVRFHGACTSCESIDVTREHFVAEKLREHLGPGVAVESVE